MKKTRQEIERLVAALDETPIDDAEARSVVETLGVDVPSLAATLRATVRQKQFADASLAYAEELARLEQKKHAAPAPPREVQLARMQHLLARVPQGAVAMHFHKYESATDEELAELVRALEHLLPDDEHE